MEKTTWITLDGKNYLIDQMEGHKVSIYALQWADDEPCEVGAGNTLKDALFDLNAQREDMSDLYAAFDKYLESKGINAEEFAESDREKYGEMFNDWTFEISDLEMYKIMGGDHLYKIVYWDEVEEKK